MIKRFFMIFLPVMACIAGIITIFYNVDIGSDRTILQEGETQYVQKGTRFIKNEIQGIVSDLIFISEHNEILKGDVTDLKMALAQMYLSFSKAKRKYDQIRFLDTSGMEIVRVNFNGGTPSIVPVDQLQAKRDRYYFVDTINLEQGEVFISPLDLNIENGEIEQPLKPVIRFSTPIFNERGETLGIVILNYLGENLIRAYKDGFNGESLPLLVNSKGYYIIGLSPEEEWGFMYGAKEQQTMANDFPEVWEKITSNDSGQFFNENGIFTFTTVYPLMEGQKSSSGSADAFASSTFQMEASEYYWKAVSLVPAKFLNVMQRTVSEKYLGLGVGMVFIAGIASWALARAGIRHREFEKTLQSSEQNFRNSLDDSPLGIRIINADGELLYANQAILDMYGYSSAEELKAMPVKQRYTPKSYAEHQERKEKRKQGKLALSNYEIEIVHKDGRVRNLQAFRKQVSWSGKTQFQVLYQDVTKRKQMEETLKKSEEWLKEAQALGRIGSWEFDVEKQTISWSEETYVLYERDLKSGPPSSEEEACYYSPDQAKTLADYAARAIESGQTFSYDLKVVLPSGKIPYYHAMMHPVKDPHGRVVKLSGTIQDITERKQMEERLRHSQVLASLGEMTAGIAHEVGNPLASILLYSEAAMMDDVSRQTRKDLKIIQNEAKRAGKLIKDLLAYSRKLELKMRRLNLHSLINKVLDMRQYQQKVHNIRTVTHFAGSPLYVQGDSSQLTQVFMNLIINAEESLQKRKGGNIKVTIEAVGEWAEISITDDGIGIPEENLNQVFHPFFTTKKVGEGAGLGLSTCYGIITAQGGLIRAENNEMGGATFIVATRICQIGMRL